MWRFLFAIALLLLSSLSLAQTSAIELKHPNGDVLFIQKLDNGDVWASFFLSDQMIASFASNELIVMQIDNHKPVKLQQGLRSCGAPAPKPQQVIYQFEQSDSDWALSGTTADKPDVLKLLGWDAGQYDKLDADRRPEVVDFPLALESSLLLQLAKADAVSFRYVTNHGEQREARFQLTPHRHMLKQLLP